MKLSLAFSIISFTVALVMSIELHNQFGAGFAFAVGLAWLGVWVYGWLV